MRNEEGGKKKSLLLAELSTCATLWAHIYWTVQMGCSRDYGVFSRGLNPSLQVRSSYGKLVGLRGSALKLTRN
jgi:hypothetical protein